MDNIRQSSLSIGQLRSKFSERVFAIPELQREFVWNAKKACGLLDSIYKKLPIGMAMVWETARQNGNEIRQELSVLPPFDDVRNKAMWCLIDGQQRLSVLYQMFQGEKINNANGNIVDFGRIFFSIDQSSKTYFHYLKYPDAATHFRVTDIVALDWRHRFRGLKKGQLSAIQKCRARILRYHFPIIFVRTNKLDEVRA